MSEAFDLCFAIIVGHEGGYANDPRDPGGETKFGISKRSFPNVDIKALTVEAAKAIYRAKYWNPIRGDELPIGLALLVMDSAINNGVAAAVKWLQFAAGVKVDGVFGPRTLDAARAEGIDRRFHATRAEAMTEMKGWPTFGRGWAIRLATLPFQAMALEQSVRKSLPM